MFPFLLTFLLFFVFLQGQPSLTWSTELLLSDNVASSLNLQVLYDLYTSTGGEYWIWHDDLGQVWNFSDPNADPCTWQGISCLLNTSSIQEVALHGFNLTGEIPDSFGALTNLTLIDLATNHLNGTIPASIWRLSNLSSLGLSYNRLSGTLSPAIQDLKNLTLLDISQNYFTSTLPPEIGNLENLLALCLQYNNFSGPIPLTVGSLPRLERLYLSFNNFSSSLPSTISQLTFLYHVDVSHNRLTGTISPSLISELPNLNYFYAGYNLLFGKLTEDMFPSSLGYLDIQTNLFSGSLPSSFGKASKNIHAVRIGENSFRGRIPVSFIVNASTLVGLSLASNFLTHDITSLPWHECVELESLHFGNNFFTGQFPMITTIINLEIRNNFFLGQVSDYLEILDHQTLQVEVLDMSSNYFSGPLSLAGLYPIYVNFSYNQFSGELSNLFGERIYCVLNRTKCPQLIDVSENEFSGTLPLNWNEFPEIYLIDVSDNRLTGTLPNYNNTELGVFAASMNCFEGSLPVSLCDSGLEVLIFNGLSSSSYCQLPIFPHTRIHTYYNQYEIEKGVPECLFTRLPQLTTLHLSGNLLTGKIPDVSSSLVDPSTLLNDLDLSYNILTGTIPLFFQNKPNWVTVDLTSNHLTGRLIEDAFPNNKGGSFTLKLSVNRLSGTLPSNLLSLDDVNVLDGNMFACNYDRSLLPDNDPNIDHYSCGSELVNMVLYFWIGLLFLVVLTLIVFIHIYYHSSPECFVFIHLSIQFIGEIREWYSFFHKYCREERSRLLRSSDAQQKSNEILTFYRFNRRCRRICGFLTLFILTVLLPTYCVLSNYYSTYAEKYIWTVSAMFLTGSTSAWILYVELLACAVLTCSLVIRLFHLSAVLRATAGQTNKELSWYKFWVYVMLSVVNFFFMLIADIVYVVTIINANIGVAILAQFILALVKIGWNNSILWKMLIRCEKWISYLYRSCCRSPALLHDEELLDFNANELLFNFSHFDVGMISTSIGLNNLIYPILAIMAVSTNCLHDAIFQPPSITSSYSGQEITAMGSVAMMTVSTSYNPPFSYGYQCSSVIYAYYTPVFVIMFTFESVVIPVLQFYLRFYYENYFDKKMRNSAIKMVSRVNETEEEEGEKKENGTERLADSFEATISRGKSVDVNSFSVKSTATLGPFCFPPVHKLLPKNLQDLPDPVEIVLLSTAYSVDEKKSVSSGQSTVSTLPFFNKNRYTVKFISAFLIIVAYGSVFPPLAIIGTISVILRTIYEETVLGRVLYEANEKRCFEFYEKQLQKDCKGIVHPIRYCLVIILPISTLLFSYLIFDTFNTTVKTDLALFPLMSFVVLAFGIMYFTAKDGIQRRRRQESEAILGNSLDTSALAEELLLNPLTDETHERYAE
jgi:Leucine-rich repeat (LRR) protein